MGGMIWRNGVSTGSVTALMVAQGWSYQLMAGSPRQQDADYQDQGKQIDDRDEEGLDGH